MCIILESSKSDRKFKCPYCNERLTRVDLVSHINEEHEDLIPEGYTAARIVFNYINKKEAGRCTECSRETKWNEQSWKYERFCERPECLESYVKKVKGRMVKVHGKEHLLNDMNHQNKMLTNRSISGNYKFKDGGVRSYCGSYERKLLEFYDKVLEVHSKDIITPGPVVEYEFKGKKHQWLTDIYYVPANLAHDAKDGGSNPNKRNMEEYRAKQIAKEEAITKQNQYNYIRLTDNNFQQLLWILSELKEQMLDDNQVILSRVHESSFFRNKDFIKEGSATAGAMANTNDRDVYIVNRTTSNTFIDNMLSIGNTLDKLYKIEDGKVKKASINELRECDYTLYKFKGKSNIISIIESYDESDVDINYFYETLTGNNYIDDKQLYFDPMFEIAMDAFEECDISMGIINSTLIHEFNKTLGNVLLESIQSMSTDDRLKMFTNICIQENISGVYAINPSTNNRSEYYKTTQDIPTNVLSILNTKKLI